MSLLPKNRRVARAALAAGLAAVLAALDGAAALAAPTAEAPAQSTGEAATSEGVVVVPAPQTASEGPAAPVQTSAIPPSPQQPAAVAAEPARKTTSPMTAAAEADASDTEAAAQAATMQGAGSGTGLDGGGEANRLNLFGFSDFTYTKPLSTLSFNPESSFAIGNLNLYLGAELGRGWRSLVEIRFMYLPDGSKPLGSPGPGVDTTATDYANEDRPIKWGGINIERAWVERTLHKLLTVRVGQFLTPYGIWNVDHGSPVYIGVSKPYVVGQQLQLFPASQSGIEIYGTWDINSTQLGYHLTLSNGRGLLDTYQDLDNNKAVGGRVFARNESALGTLSVGGSFYRGRYTNKSSATTIDPNGTIRLLDTIVAQYDELSLAADLRWQLAGLLVQGELVMNDIAYVSGGRPPYVSYDGGPAGFTSDNHRWGSPLAPVLHATDLELGVNIRITPNVVWKGQYTHTWLDFVSGAQMLDELRFQIAWSF